MNLLYPIKCYIPIKKILEYVIMEQISVPTICVINNRDHREYYFSSVSSERVPEGSMFMFVCVCVCLFRDP